MALSETFGRSDQPSLLAHIDGYDIWRAERSGDEKGGGGLCLLYQSSLVAHEWTPLYPHVWSTYKTSVSGC